MQEFAKEHNVVVIAPFRVHHVFKSETSSYGEERCQVYRPKYFSLSNKKVGPIDFEEISFSNYKKAVKKAVNQLEQKPDVIYAHFLNNARAISWYAKKNNIPLIVASGESTYDRWKRSSMTDAKDDLIDNVSHVIAVSKESKAQLIQLGFHESKISLIPNAVNYNLFKPLDKLACKEKLGLDQNKFTVGFIGHFIHRKGPNRIIEALKLINNDDIELVCVGGKGHLAASNFTKEIPPLPNFELPILYNAFDVFVLPTLHEGHCNVIEEAKACTVPIVSSMGTSVEEQIDSSIGILVDPMNIQEIADAISKIKSDSTLRHEMMENLSNRRGENSLEERAKKILRVLKDTINHI